MTTPTYQQLIIEGMKGSPSEVLAEITDFVILLCANGFLQPQAFEEDLQSTLLREELRPLSRDEEATCRTGIRPGYDQLSPRE